MAASDDDMMEEEFEEEEDTEITNPEVLDKYKAAAEIANKALAQVVQECVPGKKIVDICALGDKIINESVEKIYTKGKLEKGVAFPTCISVNHIAGHFSPLPDDTTVLNEGDLVKADLGVQIDGYIALVAHSFVASATPNQPITGRKADVISAAHVAAECAHRLIKPGNKNTDVTAMIKKVAEQFKVEPLEGVLSHRLKRYVIDGNEVIINKETLEHKVEEFEFEENQVYAVDIVMSTGEGKAKETEQRTTVYKRAVDQNYLLKMKASRYVFNEINTRFPTFPFTLRALDEKKGKLGITEMLKHDLLHPYPILHEKQGEFIAQIKFTVMITSNATVRATGHPLPQLQSEHKVTDDSITQTLALGTKRAKKNKKKKNKSKEGKSEGKSEQKPQAMEM